MPSNLVQNKGDEAAWAKAKKAAHDQYPDLSEDEDRFWKITNAIFQKISGGSTEKSLAARIICDVCFGVGELKVQYQKANGPLVKALRECPVCHGSGERPRLPLQKSLTKPRLVLHTHGNR
jgi:hypothetical protein